MCNSIHITGIGWITAQSSGNGKRLIRGHTAQVRFGPGPLPQIAGDELFAAPVKHYGRMDDFSRLGLAGIALALEDAGLHARQPKRPIGIIAATVAGCLATDRAYWQTAVAGRPSPALFARTLPNTFLGDAAMVFGLTGQAFVLNADRPDTVTPLVWAVNDLQTQTGPAMIAGICDLPDTGPAGAGRDLLPGALFLVLQRSAPDRWHHYGALHPNQRSELIFQGQTVHSMIALANACLAQGRGNETNDQPA